MHFTGVIIFVLISVAVGNFLPQHEMLHQPPQPYAFGYSVKDHHGEQHREETGDGSQGVKGSYGFTDDRGVHRQVHYAADHSGFRAQVETNEPGTANQDPAAVKMISSAHGGPMGDYGHHHHHHHAVAVPVAPPMHMHGGHVSGYDSRYGHY